MDNLGKKFKVFRRLKKITQEQLAKLSNVSRATIWRFEKGGVIKTDNLENMLNILGGDIKIIDLIDHSTFLKKEDYDHIKWIKKKLLKGFNISEEEFNKI
jgi:transcriptional regulator with XRE-family HTH domain